MNEPGVPEPSGLTYFETLPDDIRVKLIKWLFMVWCEESAKEEGLDTVPFNYGRSPFLNLLLSEDGPFCDVLSSVLTEVSWSPASDCTNVYIPNGHITIGPDLLENEEGESIAEKLLKACGESTKAISLFVEDDRALDGEGDGKRFLRHFVSLVIQYCPAVERLEFDYASPIGEFLSPLFEKYSSQLRSIKWNMWESGDSLHFPDVSHCTQIRELSLIATPQLVLVLERMGSAVESLRLMFNTLEGYGEVIDAIEQNCKKLMHIRFPYSRHVINSVGEERYAAFLCSYGTQLKTVDICGMVEPEHLLNVYKKCPNLNAEYQIVEDYGMEDWELVRIFGPKIRILSVDAFACTGEESCNAISSCTALSELKLCFNGMRPEQNVIDAAIMSVLFSLSTPSLRQLLLYRFRATKENVAMIVAATSNLRSIKLILAEPVENGTVFKAIVDSNPHLREVLITEHYIEDGKRDSDSAVELLRVLVNTFSRCRSLTFRLLNNEDQGVREEAIRAICGSLPCRGIDLYVQIGSTAYVQERRFGFEAYS